MTKKLKVAIQGYEGAFHELAARKYFADQDIDIHPSRTFEDLFNALSENIADQGIVAIENSIAGSILQNYRLLRENNCHILGEIYLRIRHQLLVIPGTSKNQIKNVVSHPMALNQCLLYLRTLENCQLVEAEDTALSARRLAEKPDPNTAVIASIRAAEIYGLEILAPNIETHPHNYTRFLIINNEILPISEPNKASIYLQIQDKRGSLLKFLQLVDDCGINMSKLQSYPILGNFRAYYFHIDLEFDSPNQYEKLKNLAGVNDFQIEELGIYCRGDNNLLN